MWPECVAGRDFEGFDNEDSAVIDDIVSLGKNTGLEVNNEEVEELLETTKMNSARKNWNNYRSSYKRRLWRKCLQRKRKEGRIFLLL